MWWQEVQEVELGETEKLSPGNVCSKCGSTSQNRAEIHEPESNREQLETAQKWILESGEKNVGYETRKKPRNFGLMNRK